MNPAPSFLDKLAAFQEAQFSSPALRSAASTSPLDPLLDAEVDPLPADAALTPLALEGKAVFVRSCMQCHGGPGLSTPLSSEEPFTGAAAMPRYHNSAATLDEVLDHYVAFFNQVKTVNAISNILATTTPGVWDRPFTREERPALLAFLNEL